MNGDKKSLIYQLDGRPSLGTAIPLGLQHVLAMFVGNVTPLIIISNALKLPVEQKTFLIQCAMLIAGVNSLIQCYPIGPIGARLPIVMGTSFGFLAVCLSIGGKYGLPGIFGAAIVGGVFQIVLGLIVKHIRKFFPPLVTGTVLLSIGLGLIPTGMKYFAGGAGAKDFGSFQNLALGFIVLITILFFKHFTKGITSMSAILIGLIVGYIVAIPMGKISFAAVANASWVSFPMPLKYGIEFHADAIFAIMLMYIVSSVETVGNVSGITLTTKRQATDREFSGAIIQDGFGSILAALFNVLPNTSYGQNVGIISMTGVVNRFCIATGTAFLILAGLFPKFGAVIALMPQSVLGGAAVVMFAMMVVGGINQITSEPLQGRNGTIIAVALGLGFGISAVPDVLAHFPQGLKMVLGGSGVVVSGGLAILLNVILPKDKVEVPEKSGESVA